MIETDRTLSYNFITSMEPTNIIHENKEIPEFIFEYLAQKNMLKLIEQSLEKTFVFAYTETYSLGIVPMHRNIQTQRGNRIHR